MNRRGFLAFLAAVPLAPVAELRSLIAPSVPNFDRVWHVIDAHGPSMTPTRWAQVVGEVHYGESLPEHLERVREQYVWHYEKILADKPLTEAFRYES